MFVNYACVLGLVTTVKYEVNQTHRIVLSKQTNKQTHKHTRARARTRTHTHTHTLTHPLSENEQRSRSSQSKKEIGKTSISESEVKKLGKKNLDPEDLDTPDRQRTDSDVLMGAAPRIFSPTEVGASAQLSESIPELPANNPDGTASEERKQLTLELCTSEVCLLQLTLDPYPPSHPQLSPC